MKKILTVLTLLLVLNLPLKSSYKIEKFYLSNGLTVVLSPEEDTDAVCVLVYHKTGVRNDPEGLKGGTHLYRNLMLLGTKNLDPGDGLLFIEKNGGISNRKIGYDNSIFYQVIPETELNNALWLESERLTSLNLTDRAIDIIKNNDYKRIYNVINLNVNFQANIEVKSIIFEGTVYQDPEYGSLEMIRSFNNREIKKIYRNFRNPTDIILVIAGKFDVNNTKKLINRHFSALTARPATTIKYNQAGPRQKYVYKNWIKTNASQHFSMYGIRAPSKLSTNHLYFNFIRYYLADERISKLDKMLNRKNNLDATVHSEYTNHIESNALLIKIATDNRTDFEMARIVTQNELDIMATKPLSQSEIKNTKTLMELDFKKDMATIEKRCVILAENVHLSAGNLDFAKDYIQRIRDIKSYDIIRTSKIYLKKSNRVILNVHPK